MPIIFASSLLLFPGLARCVGWPASSRASATPRDFEYAFTRHDAFLYNAMYVLLIFFFCYFWTAISFNPKDVSDNLKSHGTFIPGYRLWQADGRLPGKSDGADHVRRLRLFWLWLPFCRRSSPTAWGSTTQSPAFTAAPGC